MTLKGNGYVKWGVLAPLLLGVVIACLGSSAYLIDKQERTLYDTISIMQLDLREVRDDVKDLLKGM